MKLHKLFSLVAAAFLLGSSAVAMAADDFDWMTDLNIKAKADLSGFKASLAARFKLGEAQVDVVLHDVAKPADAYMVLRLGEISGRPPDEVLGKYKSEKGQGWGVIAKNLGIKPGSKEFQALKHGHDLYDDKGKDPGKDQGKDKGKSKDKGKRKN